MTTFIEAKCADCQLCYMIGEKSLDPYGREVDAYCNSEMGPDRPINSQSSPYTNFVEGGLRGYAKTLKEQGESCFRPK